MYKYVFCKFINIILYIILKYNGTIINFTSVIKRSLTSKVNIIKNISVNSKEYKLFIESSIIKQNKNYSFLNKNLKIKKKNLLIGAVKNYNWKKIEPFFKSLKKADFKNCDCIIFVDNMTQFTINKIISYGVIVHKVPNMYKKLKIINYRWKIYVDFLINNTDKYKLVFSTDLRDVFFQKDIFKFYENKKSFLGVAIEDGKLSERVNKNWIIKAYGEDLYKTIENEKIICIGSVWGTVDKFSEFSSIMWKKLNSKWSIINNVIEQAVANYLIYHDKMFNDCLIKSENSNGPVMTIGLTKKRNIRLDSENNILNGKGEIAAVIHQYDRKRDIVRKVINKYCLLYSRNINKSSFSNNSTYHLKQNISNIYIKKNILKVHSKSELLIERFHFLIYFIFFIIALSCLLVRKIIYLYNNKINKVYKLTIIKYS